MKSYGKTLNVSTWNVRTLNMLGKLENLERDAESMHIDVLGLAETRYTEDGRIRLENYVFLYSGGEEHRNGVGFFVKKQIEKHILGYWALSERNMMLKIKAKPFDIAIIQTYAPTTSHSDEEVELHYEEMQRMLKRSSPLMSLLSWATSMQK